MYYVIGGAGFIGCNVARRLLAEGEPVVIADNLSRRGAEANLYWLRSLGSFTFVEADIRDAAAMGSLLSGVQDEDVVIHLAGQVAVTASVANPREDFEINAAGSLNLLEAVRESGRRPLFIYASTNKVYGGMENVAIEEHESRYAYRDYPDGVPESAPLDFHSPYGCSKGAADQYVRDYARIYGLPTAVFRQSCIYGPRQFGVEDQGWVAWFIIAAVLGRPITIYGNGKQVRDVLYVDDLTEAYLLAAANRDTVAGKIYNVGGGPDRSMAVWTEFGPMLEELLGANIATASGPWRPGDQPVFISDISAIQRDLGWQPRTSVREGLASLVEWVKANRGVLEELGL
ncbi:MAG: NAD-dependent epimerase/dehydratase family protein [Candidatus Hydrogenedentota bacterium]